MTSPGIPAKKRHGAAGFALRYCGCKDAKSLSVVPASVSSTASPSAAGTSTTTEARRKGGLGAGANPSRSTTTDTLTSASPSFLWEDAMAEFDCGDDGYFKLESSAATQSQSFSGLLRELSELEQSVVSWGRKSHHDKKLLTPPQDQEHRTKVKIIGKGGDLTTTDRDYRGGDGVEVGLDGSVAVVKQSEDPLADFRRSMLQMIVENGIVAGVDLREMLRSFLTLNAPHHHDVILRAFAEICDAVLEASFDPVPGHSTRLLEPAEPRTPPLHRRPPSAWRM